MPLKGKRSTYLYLFIHPCFALYSQKLCRCLFIRLFVCLSKSINHLSHAESRWSAWTPWSVCSKTCGTGHQVRTRTCSKAPGSNSTCEGTSTEVRLCKIEDCNLGKLLQFSCKQQRTLTDAQMNTIFSCFTG